MDWKDIIDLWQPVVVAVVLPVVFKMAQNWLARQRWGTGAASFAGKAYIALMQARKDQPNTSLQTLIAGVVLQQGREFAMAYAETGATIGATEADAISRVKGSLGDMLAKDPSVSLAQVVEPVRNPPAPSVPLRST